MLVTDVVLGSGMNGIDLADAARVFRPGLPVIFMSGFTAVPEAQQRINESGAPLLTKPSTLSQLERALNAVMPAAAKILRGLEPFRVGIVGEHQAAALDAIDQLAAPRRR